MIFVVWSGNIVRNYVLSAAVTQIINFKYPLKFRIWQKCWIVYGSNVGLCGATIIWQCDDNCWKTWCNVSQK